MQQGMKEEAVNEPGGASQKCPKSMQDYHCDPKLKKIMRLVQLVKDSKYVQVCNIWPVLEVFRTTYCSYLLTTFWGHSSLPMQLLKGPYFQHRILFYSK